MNVITPMSKILLILIILANTIALYYLKINLLTQAGVIFLTIIITLFGGKILSQIEVFYVDKISFWIASFFTGLFVFYLAGFILLHRPILSLFNDNIRMAIATIISLMCLVVIFVKRKKKINLPITKSYPILSLLVTVSIFIAALTSYGVENNQSHISIDSDQWSINGDLIPNWGMHSDKIFHLIKVPDTIIIEKFPSERIGHRGLHITLVSYALLTGDYSTDRVINIYKILTPFFYFSLAYMLFIIGERIFNLKRKVAGIVGISSLFFSPLKYPLLDLSPTYRGFFSASGSLYHSITHLISIPCALCGLYLLYLSFKEKTHTFYFGCLLIVASFFLKPALFTVIPPAIFLALIFLKIRLTKDHLRGLISLSLVPIIWFSYLHLNNASSAFSSIIGVQTKNYEANSFPQLKKLEAYYEGFKSQLPKTISNKLLSTKTSNEEHRNLTLKIKPMAGYKDLLNNRLPKIILNNSLLLFLSVFILSFAAFLPALTSLAIKKRRTKIPTLNYYRENSHIVFHILIFMFAIAFSTLLADVDSKNQDFKWAFGAVFIISLPVLSKAICIIEKKTLRIISWVLYASQSGIGLGYLYYFFYHSLLM